LGTVVTGGADAWAGADVVTGCVAGSAG
jgi:hypothetical protein